MKDIGIGIYGVMRTRLIPVLRNTIIGEMMRRIWSRLMPYEKRQFLREKRALKQTGKESFPNQRFVVLYRANESCGIFSHIDVMLPVFCWAEEKGLIPVIDMKTLPYFYKPEGDENWWDLFFEQPRGYTIDDMANTRHKKIVNCEKWTQSAWMKKLDDMSFINDSELLSCLKRVYRKNVILNQKTKLYIEKMWENMTGELAHEKENGFLGVRLRGSAYKIEKVRGDSATTFDMSIIETVKKALEESKLSKIFLATDDSDAILLFESAFDESVLYYIKENDRISVADVWEVIHCGVHASTAQLDATAKKMTNKYLHNLNYITEIMLLAKCEGVISTKCSASICLALMKDDWKYERYI